MTKYRFEDIAYNSTEKKKPVEEDKYTYIGLEHLDPQCLEVTRYGSEVAPIGEKLVMKKGDVLFGKRRAYQKKVAIAPFDGIFSAHGMVLRPKEKVIDPKFFPMFIASDYFLDSAIKISVGSLSPTINWSALKELEFELPDLNKQHELADLLWAAEETKQAYKNLLDKSKELVQTQFIQMFIKADIKNQVPLGDLCKCMTSKISNKNILNKSGNFPVFGASGFIQNIDTYDLDQEYIGIIKDGAGVGRAYALPAYSSVMNTMQYLVPNETIKTEFLLHLINYLKLGKGFKGATIPHIYFKDYSKIIVPYPDKFQQEAFNSFVISENNSQKTLEDTLGIIDNIIKNIINQNITKEVSHV